MWRNWSGAVTCTPSRIVTPTSDAALAAALRDAPPGEPIRVAGAGHSFAPLAATTGTMISLDQMQGLVAIDPAARRATLRAGTRLHRVGPALAAHGLAMENLGDINVQSLAGATSTGTHGTGLTLPNLAGQIAGFRLVTAGGEAIDATPETEPDLFAGGRVALGSLGVLSDITMRLVPSYRLRLQRRRMDLEQCLASCESLAQLHRSFEFYWLPHTEAVLTKSWDMTDAPADHAGLQRFLTESVLENAVFGTLCHIALHFPGLSPRIARFCASMIDSSSRVDDNFSVLSTVRQVRFHETEWSMPAAAAVAALREIKAYITRHNVPVIFPLEIRWVQGDDIWLSPDYGRDSVRISAHQFVGMPYDEYFDAVEAICRNFGGRPHWGKMHGMGAADLAPLYPKWDDFLALRERLDPQGRFLSPYLRGLFGV